MDKYKNLVWWNTFRTYWTKWWF